MKRCFVAPAAKALTLARGSTDFTPDFALLCKKTTPPHPLILLLLAIRGIVISAIAFPVCLSILGVAIWRQGPHLPCVSAPPRAWVQGILNTECDPSAKRIWGTKHHYRPHLRLQSLKEAVHPCKAKTPGSREYWHGGRDKSELGSLNLCFISLRQGKGMSFSSQDN